MSRHLLSVIVAFAFFVLFAPCPTLAQYMYLDSNGDGVHTAADVLHETGATNVDVWLDTNHRRDGSEVSCSTSSDPISLMATFAVVLRTAGGTFSCSNVSSLQPLMAGPLGIGGNGEEFALSYFGAVDLGPGRFPLARLTIVPTGGAPGVDIIPIASTNLNAGSYKPFTEFGSRCGGLRFDNTMYLGADWFDVDGLAFSSGGIVSAPVISPISDLALLVGEAGSRDIFVSDAEGDVISVSLTSGPAFVTVTPLNASPGALSARIHAWPRRGDAGEYDVSVSATDLQNQAQRTFHLSVSPGPNHLPVSLAPKRIDVVATTLSRTVLTGSDSDGDPIHFTKTAGPAFAEVSTSQPGHGGATGVLLLQPTICDIGTSSIQIAVADGSGNSTVEIPIRVLPPESVASAHRTTSALFEMQDVAIGDLNEDGHLDAAAVGSFQTALQIFLGNGEGDLTQAGSLLEGLGSVAIAVGDWNQDQHLDLAIGGYGQQTLRILYGHGNATFDNPIEMPGVALSYQLASADLNGDGVDDLVAVGSSDHVTIMLGHAGSGLELSSTLPMPSISNNVLTADFNLDGTLDLIVSTTQSSGVWMFSGRGDGTFGDGNPIGSGGVNCFALTSGDWNSDGRWDIATSRFAESGMYLGFGDGAGGFMTQLQPTTAAPYYNLVSTDWNADGYADVVVPSDNGRTEVALGRGDGSFSLVRLDVPVIAGFRIADLNEDGRPDVVAVQGSWSLDVLLNPTTAATGVLARAFPTNAKVIPVVPSSRLLELRVEPVGGTFTAQDIDPASLRLISDGTGSMSSIAAAVEKGTTIGDTDHNGVPELTASFHMDDVAQLFDGVHGRMDAAVRMQATLLDARRLCAPFTIAISVNGSGSLAARIEPNPLNPQGTLKFSVRKAGPISVRLFDVKGRLVKTLWDRRNTQPGDQELAIDGRMPSGQPMSTGVYFYRIEMDGTSTSGRFAILK